MLFVRLLRPPITSFDQLLTRYTILRTIYNNYLLCPHYLYTIVLTNKNELSRRLILGVGLSPVYFL